MDVAVSERRRVGRKRQDVADCRPSTPVGASHKKGLLKRRPFLFPDFLFGAVRAIFFFEKKHKKSQVSKRQVYEVNL